MEFQHLEIKALVLIQHFHLNKELLYSDKILEILFFVRIYGRKMWFPEQCDCCTSLFSHPLFTFDILYSPART
jgi:hypothetical protein